MVVVAELNLRPVIFLSHTLFPKRPSLTHSRSSSGNVEPRRIHDEMNASANLFTSLALRPSPESPAVEATSIQNCSMSSRKDRKQDNGFGLVLTLGILY